MDDKISIKGKFFHIIYHQPLNHFTVARFKLYDISEKNIIITGNISEVMMDTLYDVTGHYIEHPKYGMQFVIETIKKVLPTDVESVISYLSSPLFPGIGKKYAKMIIENLGNDALLRIKADPKLIDDLPKINNKRKQSLIEGICDQDDLQEAIQFFSTHGLGIRNIMRLDRIYGKQALALIKENPYRLIEEVDGIGFKTADKLALSMGIELDDPKRIEAYILSLFKDKCMANGDSYLKREEFSDYVNKNLSDVVYDLDMIINNLAQRRQIIIEEDRFYHFTQYDAENYISLFLHEKLHDAQLIVNDDLNDHIESFQKEINIDYDTKQIEAIQTFLKKELMILTGGPGTGKTTVVRAMVELFKRLFPAEALAICAPTGRAAKRLSELTNSEATTIHRLLQWDLESNTFGVNENNPLSRSLLIIDEFSMVDQWLFHNLLKACKNVKKILIIGDEDQLPSVGIGSVLKDLIASDLFQVIRLTKIFRQKEGSDVITLAHQIKDGFYDILDKGKDVKFYQVEPYEAKDMIINFVNEAFKRGYSINDIQVLAPKYSGVSGIDALNSSLQRLCNPADSYKRELRVGYRVFRENDKILQLKNQPDDDVYNGDIGTLIEIVYANENDLKQNVMIVDFDGIFVEYTPDLFVNITHAYCISIHKAQGSEYPIVIMPILKQDIRMLNRRLIYTGITRASRSLIILGDKEMFDKGISVTDRYIRKTTLVKRLVKDINNAWK
ncbi:MAG: ATP-dependent RecD-like DNA helicase [Erysipelotrichaceae bacterium]|nr:ATP-dependent RecD-like DNA helicase [Erysipelotrichaceae bacterium]